MKQLDFWPLPKKTKAMWKIKADGPPKNPPTKANQHHLWALRSGMSGLRASSFTNASLEERAFENPSNSSRTRLLWGYLFVGGVPMKAESRRHPAPSKCHRLTRESRAPANYEFPLRLSPGDGRFPFKANTGNNKTKLFGAPSDDLYRQKRESLVGASAGRDF